MRRALETPQSTCTFAQAMPPGKPNHGQPQDPSHARHQPAKVTRHIQYTYGTTIHKTIPSSLGKVAAPFNSYRHTQKSKQSQEVEEYAPNEE